MSKTWARLLPGLIAGLLTLACLGLYTLTLAPDVLPADNGELQRIAAQLGVAHPPGFPLYTLLAHAITRLPLGRTPAYAANFFAALSSATVVGLVYASIHRLTRAPLAALAGGVALAGATTFWAQATTANIRSLTALFAALVLYSLISLDALMGYTAPRRTTINRLVALTGLTLGLGISHHLSLAFMGLIWGLFVVGLAGWRAGLRLVMWAVPGWLLPMLYLPWREPALRNLTALARYALGLDFGGDFFYFRDPALLWERLRVMGNVFTFQFTPGLLVGMLLGVVWLARYRPNLALLLGGSVIVHSLITATYRAPQTVEYMLPAYVPAAILSGIGAAGWARRPGSPNGRRFSRYATLIFLLLALWQGVRHYPSLAYLHTNHVARDYAQGLLDAAPPNSVVLANWHWATPLWYLQQIEEVRPDVRVAYVFPGAEPYGQTWAARIAAEYSAGYPVIATNHDEQAYQSLPIPDALGEAFLFDPHPRQAMPDGFRPLDIQLEWGVRLLGFRLQPDSALAVGETLSLALAWQAPADLPPFSLFAHLRGTDGQLYAQQDWQARYRPNQINLTRLLLTPRPGTIPGTYTLILGAYYAAGRYLHTPTGDISLTLAQVPTIASRWRPVTDNPLRRQQVDRTLVGYDWDLTLPDRPRLYLHWRTEAGYFSETLDGDEFIVGNQRLRADECRLPCHYVPLEQGLVWLGSSAPLDPPLPGQPQTLRLRLAANRPVLRDIAVSLSLVGFEADGYHWAWQTLDNGIPALGAIPTLKWIANSHVQDPRWLTPNPQALPGQATAATLQFYDAFTNRSLAVLDEGIVGRAPWIVVGADVVR